MKPALLILFFLSFFTISKGAHIIGGEMTYQYTGPSADGTAKFYRITLRLFRDELCFGCADMPFSVSIGLYNNDNGNRHGTYQVVDLASTQVVPMNTLPNCITNPPILQYRMGTYTFIIGLPNNTNGYTAAFQTCCRIDNIQNVPNSIGGTYSATIPGSAQLNSSNDSSPQFSTGISVVCHNRPFTLDFSATDSPTDSLVYSFCGAYDGGAAADASYATPAGPPYTSLTYLPGYSGTAPLGPLAQINPQTGIISGIAPNAGKYVVSVCVSSYDRATKTFKGVHRKDFIITVAPCDFAGAELEPEGYRNCEDFSMSFANLNSSPLNETYYWDFGDPASPDNISTDENPTHLFSQAGDYIIKLVVNRGNNCSDSTTAIVKVYPGFFPAIGAPTSMCKGLPVQFNDNTTTNFGVTDTWKWDFGVTTTDSDTSRLKNPIYTYTTADIYTASLIVTSDKGCIDTITHEITIVDEPEFIVSNDTLICSIDTLQLNASVNSVGNVTWSPNYNISDVNSFTPLVSPDVTTTYYVHFADNFGCTANDSVTVNVVDFVTLTSGGDTTICRTDPITLNINSNALSYTWTPADNLNDATIQDPTANILSDDTFTVVGRIGKCTATETINVSVVPYPVAVANEDGVICVGTNFTLEASGGSIYSWSPAVFLVSPNSATTTVLNPTGSMTYIVSVRDILGCPKPSFDTVNLTVVKINANAGPRDTSIVIGQPLFLNATGGTNYEWTPATYLTNPGIANPVANPTDNIEYTVRVSDDAGCFGTDTINVKVYKVEPDLYVPTAFSPDGDGLNDVFRPIPIGMRSIDLFRVYNRWGQLLFSTTTSGHGWDGRLGGMPQASGTFVWQAEGVDFRGKKIQRKGTVILIR